MKTSEMKSTTLAVSVMAAAFIGALAFTTIAQAQTTPKMKMTTDIPPQITTPDSVETRIGTLKFRDAFTVVRPNLEARRIPACEVRRKQCEK